MILDLDMPHCFHFLLNFQLTSFLSILFLLTIQTMSFYCGCHICELWVTHHHSLTQNYPELQGQIPLPFKPNTDSSHRQNFVHQKITKDEPLQDQNPIMHPIKQELLVSEEGEDQKNNKKAINQKEGRNIFSNIFRSYLKFIQTPYGIKEFYKMREIHGFQYEIEDIIMLFRKYDIGPRSYIKMKTVKKMIVEEKSELKKVLRISLLHYIKRHSREHFLTSRKTKKENRRITLQNIRFLQGVITDDWLLKLSLSKKNCEFSA